MKKFLVLMQTSRFTRLAAAAGLVLAGSPSGRSQALPVTYDTQPYTLDSGVHSNATADEVIAFTRIMEATPDTTVFRIHFSAHNLGAKSYVKMISLRDQGWQRLDSAFMSPWQNTSALFNGDQVRLELHVAPGEQGIFVRVDQLVKQCLSCGAAAGGFVPAAFLETLCGADSRVASTDFRVGRISGCTAWLVSNGAVLAAGHCGTPGGLFEVNVPASTSSGGSVAANPNDQYPIDASNAMTVNNGGGDDYNVFGLLPNSNTGQRAHVQRGFFRMSRETPVAGTTMRVTGYGVDNTPAGPVANCCATDSGGNCTHPRCNSSSRTLQTATGPFVSESGSLHRYQVDTEPANSGSPIIWNSNGFAIGIHTNGGCQDDGTGSNSGTSFENNGLETALQNFPGDNCRYVDNVTYPNSPAENGTIFQPFSTVPAAVTSVPSGGRVVLVEGIYSRAAGNIGVFGTGNKAMTFLAPVGTVIIGE